MADIQYQIHRSAFRSVRIELADRPSEKSPKLWTNLCTEYSVSGPRRDEVTGEWRRLHNEELNDQHSSPNIVRVIKSRRIRWAGHVARMGAERGAYRVLVGKPEEKETTGET